MIHISSAAPGRLENIARCGLWASALSGLVLVWRGRADTGSATAPLNAVSHWLWPRRALRSNVPSLRYTGTGVVVHTASSMLWAAVYDELRRWRRDRSASAVVADAALVTAVAAWVDLQGVPDRLSPGFQKRLHPLSTALAYGAFAAGLAWAVRGERSR